jgi:hypothetical protein
VADCDAGFDVRERQENDAFQQRDATWSSPENKTMLELQGIVHEHHRTDRVLVAKKCSTGVVQQSSIMNIVRSDWSDHFGLNFWLG